MSRAPSKDAVQAMLAEARAQYQATPATILLSPPWPVRSALAAGFTAAGLPPGVFVQRLPQGGE